MNLYVTKRCENCNKRSLRESGRGSEKIIIDGFPIFREYAYFACSNPECANHKKVVAKFEAPTEDVTLVFRPVPQMC